MTAPSRRKSCSRGDDWVLVIGSLPINGHQNAWRAVKDLLKRLPQADSSSVKDTASPKIQQVHIFQTSYGRYGVCRFGQCQQARNAFDWIGGNTWHGARIGAWLYRVGSEWHSSASLVDCWEHYPLKSTPLETFWGIGNAFLQRTPTTGPVSPTVKVAAPSCSPTMYQTPPASPLTPPLSPRSTMLQGRYDRQSNQYHRPAPLQKQKKAFAQTPPCYWEFEESYNYHRTQAPDSPAKVVICNGSDEDVPCNRGVLVG